MGLAFLGVEMLFGYLNNRGFATSCHYIIRLNTAKNCFSLPFPPLLAEQTKSVSVTAEFLSERFGNLSRKSCAEAATVA